MFGDLEMQRWVRYGTYLYLCEISDRIFDGGVVSIDLQELVRPKDTPAVSP